MQLEKVRDITLKGGRGFSEKGGKRRHEPFRLGVSQSAGLFGRNEAITGSHLLDLKAGYFLEITDVAGEKGRSCSESCRRNNAIAERHVVVAAQFARSLPESRIEIYDER